MKNQSRKLAKAMTVLTLTALALSYAMIYGPAALAAVEAPAALPGGARPLYAGTFAWKGTTLRFDVGALAAPGEGRSRFVALITSPSGETQATCERIPLGISPFDVNSVTLSCTGKLFGKSKARATFSFSELLPKPKLTLPRGKGRAEVELETI